MCREYLLWWLESALDTGRGAVVGWVYVHTAQPNRNPAEEKHREPSSAQSDEATQKTGWC
jgi:hypothetical protein